MPRQGRVREEKQPHHIICRSIEEVLFYKTDEDKEYYINLMKSAAIIFRIEILAYCLMDNHVQILLHPRGGDISKFTHAINNPYVKYYNRTHGRRGHLVSERFKNIVIKDLNQLLRNSTYIHENAKDLLYKGYSSVEEYPYSSIKDYTQPGMGRGLARPNYTFSCLGGGWEKARLRYLELLKIQSQGRESYEKNAVELFSAEGYIRDRKTLLRDVSVEMVIESVAKIASVSHKSVRHIKNQKCYRKYKALLAITLKIYSGLSLSQMTEVFMNHTSTTIGKLVKEGFGLLEGDKELYTKLEEVLLM